MRCFHWLTYLLYHTHTRARTISCIVYERQPPLPAAANAATGLAGGNAKGKSSSTNTAGAGSGSGSGGGVSLLYPKRTSLAARIRTPDALFLDFLSRLLALHPDARPTAEEALASPWLIAPPGEGPPPPPPHLAVMHATQGLGEEEQG